MRKKNKFSVLVVAKQNRAGIKYAKKIEPILKKYTDSVHFDRSTAFNLRKIGTSISNFKGDLIITIGGDGTLLMTAHKASVPVLPIRIEGKGFLCTTSFAEFEKNIRKLVKKDYFVEERMRLKCTKIEHGMIAKYIGKLHPREYPPSLNEVAFARKRPSKLLGVEIKIDNTVFGIVGDGVMFSTPFGSTAYSASAGGSIIDTSLDVINIIPLYPFYSKLKPIIVPADKKIEVTVRGGDCALIVDGHGGDYFKSNSRFLIEKAKPLKVISFRKENDFYERLHKTLIK